VETGRNSEPNPPCVILASNISELPRSELVGIVKTLKNVKNSKTLKTLIKSKNVKIIKKSKNIKFLKL
jgi:hypothetical protein